MLEDADDAVPLPAIPPPEQEKKEDAVVAAESIPAPEGKDGMSEDKMMDEGDRQDEPGNAMPFLMRQDQQAMVHEAAQAKGEAKGGHARGRGRGKGRGRGRGKKGSECEEESIKGSGAEKAKAPADTQADAPAEQQAEPQAKKQAKAKAKKQPKAKAQKQPKAKAQKQPKPGPEKSAKKRPAAAQHVGKASRVPVHNIYKQTALDVYWTRPAVGLKLRHGDQKQALNMRNFQLCDMN